MPESPILSLEKVFFAFGRNQVLDGVDLRIEKGETVVLLGENGVGKSTLMRLALGVLKPKSGRIRVLGQNPARRSVHVHRRMGYVPDVPDIYGWLTAPEWLRMLAAHYPSCDLQSALDRLERLGIPSGRQVSRMSRGEAMKLMLVGALLHDPELLLLDEPFLGLDPFVRDDLLRGVILSLADSERSVLLITHDMDIAARIADRVVMLVDSRILERGAGDPRCANSNSHRGLRQWAEAAVCGADR